MKRAKRRKKKKELKRNSFCVLDLTFAWNKRKSFCYSFVVCVEHFEAFVRQQRLIVRVRVCFYSALSSKYLKFGAEFWCTNAHSLTHSLAWCSMCFPLISQYRFSSVKIRHRLFSGCVESFVDIISELWSICVVNVLIRSLVSLLVSVCINESQCFIQSLY